MVGTLGRNSAILHNDHTAREADRAEPVRDQQGDDSWFSGVELVKDHLL